jgi:hypothetical protein
MRNMRTLPTTKEKKRIPLNMRTTQQLRTKVEQAAEASGRSLAQEVEFRVERTFWDDERAATQSIFVKRLGGEWQVEDPCAALHKQQILKRVEAIKEVADNGLISGVRTWANEETGKLAVIASLKFISRLAEQIKEDYTE